MKLLRLVPCTLLILSLARLAPAAEELDISHEISVDGWPKPIPVSIAGFGPEVDATLKFDLTFMGFTFVAADKARYQISGSDQGRVEGRVLDMVTKKVTLAKAFTGGTTRSQTHALADDIAHTLTGRPGIAQSKIACKVQPTGYGPGEIFIADYDGHNVQPVTADGVICSSPTWAGPSMLLYNSYKFEKADIFSHNLTTGARKAIARFPGSNISPSASPDGKRVAMILSKGGSPNLYVADVDGANLKQLTTTREGESSPCWSPDGKTICFVSRQSGKAALYTVPADGGEMRRLPTAGISNPTEPDWSPDGKFVVFTANMGGFSICYVPVTGPNRGQATLLAAGEDGVWAANSRAVIFSRTKNNQHVLSLLDVPTKQVKDCAVISGHASQVSWAR